MSRAPARGTKTCEFRAMGQCSCAPDRSTVDQTEVDGDNPIHPGSVRPAALFNGDRFGEIPRLIDIAATGNRRVIRQQLERHHGQQR